MGRHERRSALRDFRREAKAAHLITYLLDADAKLDEPLLLRALSWWRGNIKQRRPICICCKANFADDAVIGAHLFAMPAAAPTSASVSGICVECWRDLPDAAIEREATRLLRQLLPHGRFIDDARPRA
jgi:hypothetical protein